MLAEIYKKIKRLVNYTIRTPISSTDRLTAAVKNLTYFNQVPQVYKLRGAPCVGERKPMHTMAS